MTRKRQQPRAEHPGASAEERGAEEGSGVSAGSMDKFKSLTRRLLDVSNVQLQNARKKHDEKKSKPE